MLRRILLAMCAIAALGVVTPTAALARGGGHGGGGFRGGRFGGFRGSGFRGAGFGFYGGGYPYYASNGYYGGGGCYLARRPIRTPYGLRFRRVEVCA